MSAGFIGARGQQFRDEILVQRKLTDDALVKLNQALARTDTNLIQGNIAATLKMFKDNIQSLDATRNAISAEYRGVKVDAVLYADHLRVAEFRWWYRSVKRLRPNGE
jgi:hypothetical protein